MEQMYKTTGWKYPPHWKCRHKDCRYKASIGGEHKYCAYMEMTGRSRIAQLEGADRIPANCPFYEKKVKQRRGRQRT